MENNTIIWIIIPDNNNLTEILKTQKYETTSYDSLYLYKINNKNITYYLSSPPFNNLVSFVYHIFTLYNKFTKLDYIFLLDTCVAPDFPVELHSSIGEPEVKIEKQTIFAIESTFQLFSTQTFADCHGRA